jgi:hypothetical protein
MTKRMRFNLTLKGIFPFTAATNILSFTGINPTGNRIQIPCIPINIQIFQ